MRNWSFGISSTVVLIVSFLLITGSELLLITLHEASNLPSGTVITWLGLIALPLALLSSSELIWSRQGQGRWYAHVLWFTVFLSTSWGIISYHLSGKWNFTFSGSSPTFVGSDEASEVFWIFTKCIVSIPVLVYFIFLIHSLYLRRVK